MAKIEIVPSLKSGDDGVHDFSADEESPVVHVLAVDDSLVDRKVIEKLLKTTSCKVTAVDSGMRALQFLGLDEEHKSVAFDGLKVDLIITDYCMPGMTGYELLKKIKGSSAFREVPVVIMSSENIVARIHRCLEEGAEDFIVKPVNLSDVERLKSCVFGHKRKLEENNSNGHVSVQQQSPPSDPASSPRSVSSPPLSPRSATSPNSPTANV